MYLHLIRHGPKNNDPNVHGTGVEALLDPSQLHKIVNYGKYLQQRAGQSRSQRIILETTPVERAKATAEVLYRTMIIQLEPAFSYVKPSVNPLIGSYAYDEQGKAVNLGPQAMSKLWAEAKKSEHCNQFQGEHQPLYAWCEQGFDNKQANNPADPGISLREISCRIGTYVYQTLQEKENRDFITAIGHSGDIEPFLYLCLEMLEGRDGSNHDALTRHFKKTRGALEPLTGIGIAYDHSDLYLSHPSENSSKMFRKKIGIELFQEQDNWLK